MSAMLEVRGLDVLFDARPRGTTSRRLTAEHPLIEPPGFRVGLLGVSLTVNTGECVAVLGESGAGKSSLLRTLAGLHPMRVGTILVNGRDVTALPAEQRSIVYLHQEPVLFPHLSVEDNIMFPLRLRGVAKSEATQRVMEWMVRMQIAGLYRRRPDSLSGGERHRVALARALCASPDVLLLDEPLASLDPTVRREIRDALLAARAASGAAMVLVTHDLDDALAVATHIATIGNISLTAPMPAVALLHAPPTRDAARLLGVYSELVGTVSAEGDGQMFHWIGGRMPTRGAPSGPVVACVRAHEVRVARGDQLDAPVLTVISHVESSHDVSLELQNRDGESMRVRVSSGAAPRVGETVQLSLTNARFFAT
jgi:ABC-type sulfate/molybdate transport systems ATPase subunit